MTRQKKTHCKRGHPRTPDNVGASGGCKTCASELNRTIYKENLEKVRERTSNWTVKNPARRRAIDLANHNDLDLETVYQYLLDRGNVTVCDICQQECPTGHRLSLDHDHETNEIRGWLCGNCNQGLGRFKDSIKLMERA